MQRFVDNISCIRSCYARRCYSSHLALFVAYAGIFLINGMLLSYTNFSVRTLVGKRGIIRNGVIRLLIPYYAYGIFLLIVRWVNSGLKLSNLKWQLMDLGLFCGIGATWFLPCLFIAQILYYGVEKSVYILRKYSKCNGTMVKIILAFVIGCIPFIAPNINFVSLV